MLEVIVNVVFVLAFFVGIPMVGNLMINIRKGVK